MINKYFFFWLGLMGSSMLNGLNGLIYWTEQTMAKWQCRVGLNMARDGPRASTTHLTTDPGGLLYIHASSCAFVRIKVLTEGGVNWTL